MDHSADPDGFSEFAIERPQLTRRRFMEMAVLATSSVVLPLPRLVTAATKPVHSGHQIIKAPRDGNWGRADRLSPLSHYSSSPRKAYIMVHHAGYADSHQNTNPCTSCDVAGDHTYDFCIDRAGDICNTGRWNNSTGAHALGCNSCTVGIMLHGCFGGCGSGNVSGPSDDQLCSLAKLSLHLETPRDLNRHRPHARCHDWTCGCTSCSGTNTACPGTHLATHDKVNHWTSQGEGAMYRMLGFRDKLNQCGICFGACPEKVG